MIQNNRFNKNAVLTFISLFLIGSLLTAILTWPLILKITSFYSDIGDYPLSGFLLWYNQFSIVTGRIFNPNEYFTSFQFYPWPYSLAYSELFLVPALIFSPIYWVSHQLQLSVNLYIFLAFILSFISSFYCLHYFVKNEAKLPYFVSRYAAILGAIVYTFNPLTFAHFPDHVNFMGKYFLPPLLLWGYLFFRKPETKNALLFFLFFTLNALTSFHLMFFSNFALGIYLVCFSFLNIYQRNYLYFVSLCKKGLLFLLFIPLLAYFYLPYLNFSHQEKATYDLQFLWIYSATIKDWVSPLPNTVFYKNILPTERSEKIPGGGYPDPVEEHTLFINVIPLFLASISLFFILSSWRKKREKKSSNLLFLSINLIVLVVSVVLSFGPQLTLDSNQSTNIKLPVYYLIHVLPIFKASRVLARFQFIFYIPFSILVSYGFVIICQKWKRRCSLIFILLTVLMVGENFNDFKFDSTSKVLGQKQILEQNFRFLDGKNTLHFPRGYLGEEARYLNFGTITHERMINGYSGYTPPDWFSFMAAFKTSLREDDLKKLNAIGIQYIIIHKDILSAEQAHNLLRNQALLQKGTIFDEDGIQVINLDNLAFDIKLCSFDKDLDFKLERTSSENTDFYRLNIENQSNCYLASTLQNRYRSKIVYQDGTKTTAFIRMPIVIAPFEKISVDEQNRNLAIEQEVK